MDNLHELARLQFALTASFHIIFPTLLIGLSTYLSFLYWRWKNSHDQYYLNSYQLWLRLTFYLYILAAITGIALAKQIDLVFPGFYTFTGPVLLPIRELELILAAVFEGGCIGVMLLCSKNIYSRTRLLATILFNIGIFLTTFLVISRNSWMNTPAGIQWTEAGMIVIDWFEVIMNPTFPLRYLHMLFAGFIATSMMLIGIGSFRLLRCHSDIFAYRTLSFMLPTLLLLSVVQFIIGDLHGYDVYQNQPEKIAKIEAQWKTERSASFKIFAIPRSDEARNTHVLEVPKLLSLLLTHDPKGLVLGLDKLEPSQHTDITIPFYSFRIMILMGIIIFFLSLLGTWLIRRTDIRQHRWFLRMSVIFSPAGLIAVIFGWATAETARQPWVVFGIIKTSDIINLSNHDQVITSLTIFLTSYTILAILSLVLLYKSILKKPAF